MKLGSLFDGSGGFPLAGSLCGIEPVWASEVEPYPIAVTRERFPKMKHLGNISLVNGAEIEPVDIITFGSPCQDLSVAGKRAGLKHEANGDEETTRSGLFMEAVRIIKEMREATDGMYPRFALWENVPGAFSSNKGEDFRIVLEEIIKSGEPGAVMPEVPKGGWAYADSYIGDGWSLAYRVFDAQYWGVPQRRRRIHLVADFSGGCAGKILFDRQGLRGDLAESGTPRERTAGDAESGFGTADRKGKICLDDQGGSSINVRDDGKSPTLRAETHGNIPCVMVISKTYDARGNGDGKTVNTITGDHENRITDYTSVVCESIPIHDMATRFAGRRGEKQDGKGNGMGIGEPGDPMNTLTSGDRHAVAYAQQTYQKVTDPLMANSHPGSYTGQDAFSDMLIAGEKSFGVDCRNMNEYTELYPTLQAKPNGGQSLNFSGAVRQSYIDSTYMTKQAERNDGKPSICGNYQNTGIGWWKESPVGGTIRTPSGGDSTMANLCVENTGIYYIVRRLTPTECAGLQGFPDDWGHIGQKEELTDEEYAFWLNVRKTHAEINGKTVREWTKKQMLAWYNKIHSDSAEYKMWGNGIALPPAVYCMQGIAEVLKE